MQITVRPFNFHKRDDDFAKAVKDDQISSDKLLEIEYGEFPMKGIQVANNNDRPVSIRNFFQDKSNGIFSKLLNSVSALGYVPGRPKFLPVDKEGGEKVHDRAIYMNKLIYSPLGQYAALKWLHLPLAKGIAATLAAGTFLSSTAALLKSRLLLTATLLSSARLAAVVQFVGLPFRAMMDTVGHEHVHVLQVHDEANTGIKLGNTKMVADLKEDFSPLLKAVAFFDNTLALGTVKYYSQDYEIQARLHTVLADGYRNRWHRMPETKHELWGALISSGLAAPEAIRRELKESTEEGVKDFYDRGPRAIFNRYAAKITKSEVADLNVVTNALYTDDRREKYWRDVLPMLYGHLVELYGDSQGRARMGIVKKEPSTLTEIYNARVGKVVNNHELIEKVKEMYKTELSLGERILLNVVEKPVSLIGAFIRGISKDHMYVDKNDVSSKGAISNVYIDEAFFEVAQKRDVTITPALTRKTYEISRRARESCKDYSQDLLSGRLTPVNSL